jgi:hypothetical protein
MGRLAEGAASDNAPGAIAAAVAFSLTLPVALCCACPYPEDWDGGGFALASQGVDLAAFRPHPPGYPAYLAVARVAGAVGCSPALAAVWLSRASALGLALFAAGLAALAPSRRRPWERGACATAVTLGFPGLFRLGTSVGPAALSLGGLALGLAAMRARPSAHAVHALLFGLSLSARPTDAAPILACAGALFGLRALRPWALGTAVAAVAHAPFMVAAGPRGFLALCLTHFSGHLSRWGSSVSDPLTAHLRAIGGFVAESNALVGCVLGLVLAALAASSLGEGGRREAIRVAAGAMACEGWVLWMQPPAVERHLAWLVFLCALGLLRVMLGAGTNTRLAVWALCGIGAVTAVMTARERRAVPPAGVQIARWLPRDGALFAGRSARDAQVQGLGGAYEVVYFGEVRATLERLPRLPVSVWVTGEVRGARWGDSPGFLRGARRVCGPRSARGEDPCLRVGRLEVIE